MQTQLGLSRLVLFVCTMYVCGRARKGFFYPWHSFELSECFLVYYCSIIVV